MNLNRTTTGILLAVLATIIWSGNFIVARGVINDIPPVLLAFSRWLCASIIMLPLGWKAFRAQWPEVKKHPAHLFWAAVFGVSIFNTLVYIAGHFSQAINLALIGTTSSPVFSFILARIFLKERIPPKRMAGLLICIAGILIILSRGSIEQLYRFQFTKGDWWILAAALSFAIYNVLAKRKPTAIRPVTYLFTTFWIGTLLILPFAIGEYFIYPQPIHFTAGLAGIILYLGAGTSVASFFCWNAAIARLGAANASLFGNLIPVFSSLEAVWLLNEKILPTHIAGMIFVFAGLFLSNLKDRKKKAPPEQVVPA